LVEVVIVKGGLRAAFKFIVEANRSKSTRCPDSTLLRRIAHYRGYYVREKL